jgi:dTDP-4-dehydrorhamnose 3,5-epimerase
MRFHATPLPGALLVEPERLEDERGFFARSWCREEFADHGIHCDWVQCNISYNRRRGTLRGLHYQAAPHEEAKLVRCTRGKAFDVIVDLRPQSVTFGRWAAFELSAENHRMVFVPAGFAHGFQTLADDTELFYQMSEVYCPEKAGGVRWDDPLLAIDWPPCPRRIISPRDLSYRELRPCGAC